MPSKVSWLLVSEGLFSKSSDLVTRKILYDVDCSLISRTVLFVVYIVVLLFSGAGRAWSKKPLGDFGHNLPFQC